MHQVVLAASNHVCEACGYESKPDLNSKSNLGVYHLDDNHENNDAENLCPACSTCHPYQHVGESLKGDVKSISPENMGKITRIAVIPELSARDLNLLQRAIGVALLDESEAPMAKKMMSILIKRQTFAKAEFDSFWPVDFGNAMVGLTDEEYAERTDAMPDLRILFNEDALRSFGAEMLADYPTMPLRSWEQVVESVGRKSQRLEKIQQTQSDEDPA